MKRTEGTLINSATPSLRQNETFSLASCRHAHNRNTPDIIRFEHSTEFVIQRASLERHRHSVGDGAQQIRLRHNVKY